MNEQQARQALRSAVADVHLDPGSWQGVPGRQRKARRQQRLALTVSLALVVALAVALTPPLRSLLSEWPSGPAGPAATTASPPKLTAPVTVARGVYKGRAWTLVAEPRAGSVCTTYGGLLDGGSGPCIQLGQPGKAVVTAGASSGVDQPIFVSGVVRDDVAEVRIGRIRGAPLRVRPVGRDLGLGASFYVTPIPGTDDLIDWGKAVVEITAYDRAGNRLGVARLTPLPPEATDSSGLWGKPTGPVRTVARGTYKGKAWEMVAYRGRGNTLCSGFTSGPAWGAGGCEEGNPLRQKTGGQLVERALQGTTGGTGSDTPSSSAGWPARTSPRSGSSSVRAGRWWCSRPGRTPASRSTSTRWSCPGPRATCTAPAWSGSPPSTGRAGRSTPTAPGPGRRRVNAATPTASEAAVPVGRRCRAWVR